MFTRGKQSVAAFVFIALIIILIWSVYYVSLNRQQEQQVVVTTGITINDIQEIARLSSVEYMQSVVMSIDDPGQTLGPLTLPGTKRRYLAIAQGTVGAGIDLEQIEDFSIEENRAVIGLPPAVILYKYIMPETLQVWDEQEGIFVRITACDTNLAQMAAEDEMVKKALENGILEKADQSARKAMETFLRTGGIEEVEFR